MVFDDAFRTSRPAPKPGDHLFCIYGSESEHRALVAPFLAEGLRLGQKVVYAASEHDAKTLLNYLEGEGLSGEDGLARGQLVILDRGQSYLEGGRFDPERMRAKIKALADQARKEGKALRITGESGWACEGYPGSERLLAYESGMTHFCRECDVIALCQYDRRRVPPERLLQVLRTHPLTLIQGRVCENFYHIPPAADDLVDDDGTKELSGWLHNLEERHETENFLKWREKKYHTYFNDSPAGILIADAQGNYKEANPAICRMTGYSETELLRMSIPELLAPESLADGLHQFEQVKKDGRSRSELRMRSKNGDSIMMLVNAVALSNDRFIGFCEDITERWSAETKLREKEEQYRSLFTGMSSGFCLCEMVQDQTGNAGDFRFLQVNPAFERLTGVRNGDVVGRTVYEVFPEPNPVWLERFAKVALQGWAVEFEEFSALLGRWFEVRAFSPSPGQFAVAFNDTTERRQTEERLRQSEARYRTLVEALPHGVQEVDPQGRITYVNRAYQDIIGYGAEEMIGECFWDYAPTAEQREEYKTHFLRFADRQLLPAPFLGQARRRDGAIIDIQEDWDFRCDESGAISGFIAIITDITELKLASEALRQARDFLENLITNANAPIIVLDAERKITRFNRASEELIGIKANDVLARPLEALFPDGSSQEMLHCFRYVMAGNHVESIELPMRRADGHIRTILWNAAAIYDAEGASILATIFQGQDITERRHAERLVLEAGEQEKRRIGQDLHDGLLQQITGAYYACQALHLRLKEQDSPECGEAGQISALLKQSIRHARELSHGLYPATLTRQGLVAALQQLAEEITGIRAIQCRFQFATNNLAGKEAPPARLLDLESETSTASRKRRCKTRSSTPRPASSTSA